MATFDSAAYSAALKIKYGKKLVSQVNDRVKILPLFSDESDSWVGRYVLNAILLGRGQSFMAHGSLGQLPIAKNETTLEQQIPVKWVRGRIQFETALMFQSTGSVGAFAKASDLLMKRLVVNLSDELNRMLSAGSGTGVLALVDDSTSVGSVADPLEIDAPGGIASDGYGTRYLQPGMLIGFTADGVTVKGIRTVNTIVAEGATLSSISLDATVVNGVDYANNDYIVRVANPSITNLTRDSSYNNEPMGLQGIVDDGTLITTFHNISRTDYPDWAATRISTTVLSIDALQQLSDTIDQQSGESPTHHLVHHSMRRQYLALADQSRVFMQTGTGPGKFDVGQGKTEASYNGDDLVVDKDLMLGEWMMVNRNHLTRYVLREGEWAEETGSMFRAVAGQDALEAIYRHGVNYSTDMPNSHGKLTGMSITNAIRRHVV